MLRNLPDQDIVLRDAADFILDSRLGRAALACSQVNHLPLLLRDVIGHVHKLVASCHMPEFTDHGLPHLCSLVEKISSWTCATGGNASQKEHLVDKLKPKEAAALLMATLVHDIGMLSQNPQDLEVQDAIQWEQSRMDLSIWVRKTHVLRMPRLVRRLLQSQLTYSATVSSSYMDDSFGIAGLHGSWPWDNQYLRRKKADRFLAAVLAVVDLLDEDANRCDTETLMGHRFGDTHNKAHWLRHGLSKHRASIIDGQATVSIQKAPDLVDDGDANGLFAALRNLYRLSTVYNIDLKTRRANFSISFNPSTGCPLEVNKSLKGWTSITGFGSQKPFCFHLLNTFFHCCPNASRIAATGYKGHCFHFRSSQLKEPAKVAFSRKARRSKSVELCRGCEPVPSAFSRVVRVHM